MKVHPTAIVHPKAELGEGTTVGAYAIVDEHVRMGARCEIQNHAMVTGWTQLGDEVRIFPFAVVGAEPQHLNYQGEPTTVVVGNRVTLRESVTVHRGTPFGHGTTVIKDNAFIMAYTHVAHDCIVGKNAVIANAVQMAGHTEVDDYAVVGGLSAIVQYCRVGRYSYVGGGSLIRKDVLPFIAGKGNEFEVQGINVVGLTRQGFSAEAITRLKKIYKIFFLQKLTLVQALDKLGQELGESDEAKVLRDFLQSSKVGIHR